VKPIFISYSSKHRDLTRALAGVIEAQYGAGSVWWDHELESRASYSEQIRAALEEARVVVVLWTAGAMISDYVYAEAVGAQAQGKLVNVRPADMRFSDIPEPFNIHHIDEAEDHARVLATIAKVMTGEPIPTRVPLHDTRRKMIACCSLAHREDVPRLVRQLATDPEGTSLLDAGTFGDHAAIDICLSRFSRGHDIQTPVLPAQVPIDLRKYRTGAYVSPVGPNCRLQTLVRGRLDLFGEDIDSANSTLIFG
jgi:hypothetical protein